MENNALKHRGIFGVNVYTITKSSNKGEEYNAYHNSELVDDIIALLEGHGYIVEDVFLDFKEEQPCTEREELNFENYKLEREYKAKQVYSKANVKKFTIE